MNKYFNNKGSLLMDALIAIVILSVAIPSIISVFAMITKARSASEHRTMALRIIEAQFNDLQKSGYMAGAAGWTQVSNRVQSIIDNANNPANGTGNVSMNFAISSELVTTRPTQIPASGLQGVKITVSWNGPTGNEHVTETNYFYTQDATFNGGLTYVSLTSQ